MALRTEANEEVCQIFGYITLTLPEVIKIIPAITAEVQRVALQTQSAEQLPHCFWSSMQD